jgi:hypothetical protein
MKLLITQVIAINGQLITIILFYYLISFSSINIFHIRYEKLFFGDYFLFNLNILGLAFIPSILLIGILHLSFEQIFIRFLRYSLK